jgi:hypothetical protein
MTTTKPARISAGRSNATRDARPRKEGPPVLCQPMHGLQSPSAFCPIDQLNDSAAHAHNDTNDPNSPMYPGSGCRSQPSPFGFPAVTIAPRKRQNKPNRGLDKGGDLSQGSRVGDLVTLGSLQDRSSTLGAGDETNPSDETNPTSAWAKCIDCMARTAGRWWLAPADETKPLRLLRIAGDFSRLK